ncbi:hypothetical protein F4604DRAFT_1679359 [Suillus subluteus]|nr:hypothetical protein F4604DRAFT_1679359 [Suillus subluteus]
MPSSEDSNKALNDAAAEVVQILVQAMKTKGQMGQLSMAMEMANIMSATKISPVLLSAAMELKEHCDPVSRLSFVSMPIWTNIVMNDPHIKNHPLHVKAHNYITPANQVSLSSPSSQLSALVGIVDGTAQPPALPAAKLKLKPKPVPKKKPAKLSLEGDGIEVVDGAQAVTKDGALTKVIPTIGELESQLVVIRGKGKVREKITVLPADVDAHAGKDVAPTDVPLRQKPQPNSKDLEGRRDLESQDVTVRRKGKGKEVVPLEHVAEGLGHGRPQKRHRDASSSRPPTKRNIASSRPPATDEAGPTCMPRVDESGPPTPDTVRTHTGKQHKSVNHSSMPMEEVEVGQTEHVQAKTKTTARRELEPPCTTCLIKFVTDIEHRCQLSVAKDLELALCLELAPGLVLFRPADHAPDDDEDMLLSDDSAAAPTDPPPTMSVPAIATISLVPSSSPLPKSSQTLKWRVLPPPETQRSPVMSDTMDIDLSGDAVVKELEAMTLKMGDSASPVEKNHGLQAVINSLKTELTELCARHTASTLLILNMNVRLAEQETSIQNLEAMRDELTALQQDVKDMQVESHSREEQLRTPKAKLAEQAHSTSILQEAYESLRQCVMPNVSIPPAFSNTMFLPIPSYSTPYSQGFSAGQAQAMEHLYTNITPGPSTAAGMSVAHAASSSGQNGVAGSSTNQNASSSHLRRVFSESASGTGPL